MIFGNKRPRRFLRAHPGWRKTAFVLLGFVLAGLLGLRVLPRTLPWEGESSLESLAWSVRILDRRAEEIQVLPVNENGLRRIFSPLEEVPKDLRRIVRLSEDKRFYVHPGFDPISLARAAFFYFRGEELAGGGSTISMQLARILSPRAPGAEPGFEVKSREIWRALQIESRLTKKEILELYINLVPFGRNIEGFPAASRVFFRKDLSALNAEEMLLLSVIPRSPSRYDPLQAPEASLGAIERLAEKLGSSGTKSEHLETILKAQRSLQTGTFWPFEAPQFVEGLRSAAHLWTADQRLGKEAVRTTLDLTMQREAQKSLRYNVDLAGDFRIGNGAMLLADAETMEVLVYLGSADFYDEARSGQIDGVRILREPGSTLKPFLYASALDSGWTASTILPDIPIEFGNRFSYTPMNYDQQYHGPVRLRQALAASLNIPAVYTLERLSMERFTETLINAGFESLVGQQGHLGVSLAVGGGEVSLAELVQGYGALRNGGVASPLRVVPDQEVKRRKIWSLESADIITDIISGSDDRILTFGRGGPVRFDYPAAIKTGTSNQFNNIWALGFTTDLVGGVWMGNFDGSTVIAAPGSSIPASVLHEAFDRWSTRGPIEGHAELEHRRICSLSGLEATEHCPYTMDEIYAYGTAPVPCSWHQRSAVHYPQEYLHWADRYGYDLTFRDESSLNILYPTEGSIFFTDKGLAASSGDLRISLVGSGSGSLRANGEVIYDGDLPAEIHWPLEPGIIHFELRQGNDRVLRRIEIR